MKIIAEIAQGHEGSAELCQLLTRAAVAASADIIKYQVIYANELSTQDYPFYEFFQGLEMGDDTWERTVQYVRQAGKQVFFDVYGNRSLDLAIKLNVDGVKLSTTEFYNAALFQKALESIPLVLVSLAGIPVVDIDQILIGVSQAFRSKLIFIYGFQSEPTPLEETNLNKLLSFKERYPDISLGFMDHSDGSQAEAFHVPLIAMGYGIEYIEKHLTLDRVLEIEDYISALDASSFKQFVKLIRKYECVLGQSSLELTESEQVYQKKAGKVVVTQRELNVGAIVTESDIALKRAPKDSVGTRLKRLDEVVGKTIVKTVMADSLLAGEYLK
jgi:N,N'-diacetyllegionaminate synthase